jgi:hypothetical protein
VKSRYRVVTNGHWFRVEKRGWFFWGHYYDEWPRNPVPGTSTRCFETRERAEAQIAKWERADQIWQTPFVPVDRGQK